MRPKVNKDAEGSDQIPLFPEGLLTEPIEARVNYFKSYTIAHPLLMDAFSELIDNVFNPSNRTIQFLYGPSGVGKTTIFKKVKQVIIERSLPSLEADKGIIPYAALEAVAPDNGSFDWKDFYIRLLEELRDVAINHKVDFDAILNQNGFSNLRAQDPNRTLRKAVESTLRHRRPIVLMIDEAQHMMKMTSGKRLRNQMDSIKSLASQSNTPIVLIGTYELLQFTNLSGQLARRSDDVHFQRYRMENSQHMEWFESALYMFQKNMPLEVEPDLIGHTDFFYERCIGCIGTLKDWLAKTLEMKLLKGEKSLTIDDFKEYALSIDQCIKMIREAREGEMKLEENDEKKRTLYNLLMANVMPNQNCDENDEQTYDHKPQSKGHSKKGKPGKRNPKRDSTEGSVKEGEQDAV
ncbi:AAA family ATPase [Brevibacillus invocatus]|nr:AAA family ATPase [Brevibacillus invocatus]